MLDRVILIDDDRVTNFLGKKIVEQHFAPKEIKIFKNGQEALDYFQEASEEGTQLVFLDINMPVLNGIGLLEKLNELPTPVKDRNIVVMLSSAGYNEEHDRALALGARTHLHKPLTAEKIKEVGTQFGIDL